MSLILGLVVTGRKIIFERETLHDQRRLNGSPTHSGTVFYMLSAP
jgi:hypothetical protein